MQGDRALGLGAKLRPHHATHADRRALRGEHLFITHMELIAGSHVAAEIDRRGESPPRLEHRRRRHASLCERYVERRGDGATHRDLAREGLAGEISRVFVSAAQQACLRDAGILQRCIVIVRGDGR